MQTTIRAIFEKGVFRPTSPVYLPESAEVVFELRLVTSTADADSQAGVYRILGKRYQSGEHDVAERHEEHQP